MQPHFAVVLLLQRCLHVAQHDELPDALLDVDACIGCWCLVAHVTSVGYLFEVFQPW